jgi:hypothetical protein
MVRSGLGGSGMIDVGSGGTSVGRMDVGGISVGGTSVGGTGVRVGARDVPVGTKRVEVGRPVGEAGIGVWVPAVVGRGSRVRAVAVSRKVGVGEGVRVALGVAVGMVDVTVGGSDGVGVGAVEVGKGPKSAFAVRARAVLVVLAPCSEARSLAGSLKANQKYRITPSRSVVSPTARRSICRFKMFNSNNSFLQNHKDKCWQNKAVVHSSEKSV